MSETYNFQHLTNITSSTYNYRLTYDLYRQSLYYSRYDFRSPANYVNKHVKLNDTVLTSVKVTDHYLNRVDYTYLDKKQLGGVVGCNGECYIWNKTKLISDLDKIKPLISSAQQNLWILSYSSRNRYRPDIGTFLENNYKKHIVYTNLDRSIYVYKI